jgi:hypothetical protein
MVGAVVGVAATTACEVPADGGDGGDGEDEGEADCGEGTEARAIEVEVAPRVTGLAARPGQGVRDGALLDAQFLGDGTLSFSGACDPCAGSASADLFADGTSIVAIHIVEEGALLDVAAVEAWVGARAAAIADGAITKGSEALTLAPRWTLANLDPAADYTNAEATDLVVDNVQAGVWLATALEILPGNECAADEVRRLLAAPGETDDDISARDAAIGRVLTASGGTIRIAVASTIAPEHFAAIDTSPCTVSTWSACLDVVEAYSIELDVIDEGDLDVVLGGTHGMWQPMRFRALDFLADGE